jgi:hypothetical protein
MFLVESDPSVAAQVVQVRRDHNSLSFGKHQFDFANPSASVGVLKDDLRSMGEVGQPADTPRRV